MSADSWGSMFGILTSLTKFGTRSALRALPREIRQPIRFVVSPIRTVRRAITPPVVRDAQRLVRQATNPVSSLARSLENSIWQGAEEIRSQGVNQTAAFEANDSITISGNERETQLEYECPHCKKSVHITIPGFEEASQTPWLLEQRISHYVGNGLFKYYQYFDVQCASCTSFFRSSITYEVTVGPYVYKPKALPRQVLDASAQQVIVTILFASFLLISSDMVLLGFAVFLGLFFGAIGAIFAVMFVVEHRFAELREHRSSSLLLRSVVVLASALAPVGAIVAVGVAAHGLESDRGALALGAFAVQILFVIPISQTLACFPIENYVSKSHVQQIPSPTRAAPLTKTRKSDLLISSRFPCLICNGKVVRDVNESWAKCRRCRNIVNFRDHPDVRNDLTDEEREVLIQRLAERERLENELRLEKKALRLTIEDLGLEVQKLLNPKEGDVADDSKIRRAFEAAERLAEDFRSKDEREATRASELIARLRREFGSLRDLRSSD